MALKNDGILLRYVPNYRSGGVYLCWNCRPVNGFYTGAGAAGIDVAEVYFCGAQAIGYGVARRWNSREELFDYGRKKGCAIVEQGGFEKMTFGSGSSDTADLKDHGVFTGVFASVAD